VVPWIDGLFAADRVGPVNCLGYDMTRSRCGNRIWAVLVARIARLDRGGYRAIQPTGFDRIDSPGAPTRVSIRLAKDPAFRRPHR
jgi:hypothetical protein